MFGKQQRLCGSRHAYQFPGEDRRWICRVLESGNHVSMCLALGGIKDDLVEVPLEERGDDCSNLRRVESAGCSGRPAELTAGFSESHQEQCAVSAQPRKELHLVAETTERQVLIRVIDSGSGVPGPVLAVPAGEQRAHGLGLYLSRAFMRSFSGRSSLRDPLVGVCFRRRIIYLGSEGEHRRCSNQVSKQTRAYLSSTTTRCSERASAECSRPIQNVGSLELAPRSMRR